MSGTTDNLNRFHDGLRNLKRELKKLGAGNKIKEFGLDDKNTIKELYDQRIVTKADKYKQEGGRPDVTVRTSPWSFLSKKYKKQLQVLRKGKQSQDTIEPNVT